MTRYKHTVVGEENVEGTIFENGIPVSVENLFTYPKGNLTSADINKFLMSDSSVAAVYAQEPEVTGQYNTWTIEILDFPSSAGVPAIWTVEITSLPSTSDHLSFQAGSTDIYYDGENWQSGETTDDAATNLATGWNAINPPDGDTFTYTAVAVGSIVTFTQNGRSDSGPYLFQWYGTENCTLTQTQVGSASSSLYFAEYAYGYQHCIYGYNWLVGLTLGEVATNLAAAWNALEPTPLWQKLDAQANPISNTPWSATANGTVVTLTQTAFGDPGNPNLLSDNYSTPPTIANTVQGREHIPALSTKPFIGILKSIDGPNATIEVKLTYSALAKGAISSTDSGGIVSIVDGTHIEMRNVSPVSCGDALFDAVDGAPIIFRGISGIPGNPGGPGQQDNLNITGTTGDFIYDKTLGQVIITNNILDSRFVRIVLGDSSGGGSAYFQHGQGVNTSTASLATPGVGGSFSSPNSNARIASDVAIYGEGSVSEGVSPALFQFGDVPIVTIGDFTNNAAMTVDGTILYGGVGVALCDGTYAVNTLGAINTDTGFAVGATAGYTGDLKDSTSTKIADVVGGIITKVYF